MKIICTTSDKYNHCLKVFIYLFNANWPAKAPVEIVGYKKPDFELPDNFSFHSMGEQGPNPSCFSRDIRTYLESIPDEWVIWFFEDSFIKSVDEDVLDYLFYFTKIAIPPMIGRIDLGDQARRGPHDIVNGFHDTCKYKADRAYRLSTQPSIWNVAYLKSYLKDGMSPWDFERQHPVSDGWEIIGHKDGAIKYNEGVFNKDIYKMNLEGVDQFHLEKMKELGIM